MAGIGGGGWAAALCWKGKGRGGPAAATIETATAQPHVRPSRAGPRVRTISPLPIAGLAVISALACVPGTPAGTTSPLPEEERALLGCYSVMSTAPARLIATEVRLDSTLGGGGALGRKGWAVSLNGYAAGYWRLLPGDSLEIAWTMSNGTMLWDETRVRVSLRGARFHGRWNHSSDVRRGNEPREGEVSLMRSSCGDAAPA